MSDLFGGLVIIAAGTLYPAYSSYKAVKTKNTREYVKWMMYWIVFAFFNAITLFTDIFISWFPGYYLFKTLFIIWLVSPATRGSTYLYKKILHPALRQNEEHIDRTIANIKDRGYDYTSQWARVIMQNFSKTLMEAVFKGQVLIADQMQRQYVQNNLQANPSGVVTDGREVENMRRSAPPSLEDQGRLYRVDSQMFEMDDEFVELSAEMNELDRTEQGTARQRRRANKSRNRPVSMPPPMIEEHHPLEDGSVSDPDYSPEQPARSSVPESTRRRGDEQVIQKRVTRSSARDDAPAAQEPASDDEDDDFMA